MEEPNYNYENWKRALETVKENQKSLDNVVFVLGTGIFVLSINFITGNSAHFLHKELILFISWISLASAIIAHVIAYKIAIIINVELGEHLNPIGRKIECYEKRQERFKKWVSILDTSSMILIIVGISLLTYFVAYNFHNNNLTNLRINQ